MVPVDGRRSTAEHSGRRKVRIVRRRLPPKAALFSLLIAASAAAVAFMAWRVWRQETPVVSGGRTLSDVLLNYRCGRGDSFRDKGRVEPIPCLICGRPAHPVAVYSCSQHGDFEVLVQFDTDSLGEAYVAKLRVWPSGEWHDAESGAACPRCGELMTRKPTESLDFNRLRRREGEGTPRRPVPPDASRIDPPVIEPRPGP